VAVMYVNKAMNHTEGGWPKEVDCTEAEHVIRYRKKVLQRAWCFSTYVPSEATHAFCREERPLMSPDTDQKSYAE